MRVPRLLSAICEQKATGKGFRFRWIWVSGRLVRYVWWVSILKFARGRDSVCRAAAVDVARLICIGLCIALQELRPQAINAASCGWNLFQVGMSRRLGATEYKTLQITHTRRKSDSPKSTPTQPYQPHAGSATSRHPMDAVCPNQTL